jgi:aryl-alcohol dehydrogenase-like predicted oxidoreductase/predicted kinase
MRLSTEASRDDAAGAAVVAAAIDAGVDLLDTADAYAHGDHEIGHNERLIARAVAGRRVTIVTKGGLTRPGGAWVPDGRAKHLAAAARASRDRLGVDAIDLYLLHAIDPRTPLATSVRALARLRDDGVVRRIGLSNVGIAQLDEAVAIAPIDAVEVELSPWRPDAIRGGLIARCASRGITVLAHRPLGGAAGAKRLVRDPVVVAIAARLGATPAELAIAWLRAKGCVPIPGATRIETAISAARAAAITLDDDAIAALDARFLAVGEAAPRAGSSVAAEVAIVMGMPAAGKSTLAADYVARGYLRLNRDDRGGSLLDLARALDRELAGGAARVVLDNTYATRATRAPVVEIARRHGAAVRCVVVATPIEEAQAYAVTRMLDRHGRLLEPDELARDPREVAPSAQFRWRRAYEPPGDDEGFDAIEEVRPVRVAGGGTRAALIVELDDVVWVGRPQTPAAIELRDGARDALGAWKAGVLAGTTWQPGGIDVPAMQARLADLLGMPIAIACCAHAAGPPICWCRKPLPGLGLALVRAHDLDRSRTMHVGRGPADRGFALRLGVGYLDVGDGWPSFDSGSLRAPSLRTNG